MRKFITAILLFLFFVNSAGYYFLYQLRISYYRNSVAEMISDASYDPNIVQTIIVPLHDPSLRFIEKKEFIYKGYLYDVEEMHVTGENIVIRCIADAEEEEMRASFNANAMRQHRAEGSKSALPEFKFFTNEYCTGSGFIASEANIKIGPYRNYLLQFYANPFLQNQSPPPKA